MHNLSDKELYSLCQKYGENALHWRRKFIGLLPEVNRRRLYKKKGFASVFEFAKKLCGLSEKQVRLTLNLEERFLDKPALKALLTSGAVSINKLTRVTSVATVETEAFWAEKVRQLSQSAIETLVRDTKNENANHLFRPQIEVKSLRAQKSEDKADELDLAPDVVEELLELKAKGIDVNQVLRELLEARKLEIAREKEKLSAVARTVARTKSAIVAGQSGFRVSRYIPAKIRRHLAREYGTKCSINGCGRLAQVIHHTQRFALTGSHNPQYLAPLCREHHAIAHAIDTRVQAKRSSRWDA